MGKSSAGPGNDRRARIAAQRAAQQRAQRRNRANYITAALCKLTGNKPATACTQAVQALQAKI